MSEQLKKGDLVYVAKNKACCNSNSSVGFVFSVSNLRYGTGKCMECNQRHEHTVAIDESGNYYEASRLKKIPPLPESETIYANESATV